MTPDDPRHSTNPGYNAGCRDACCRHAHMVWMKRYRLYGGTDTTDATGTHRRIQALMAIGHPLADISEHAGKHRTWVNHILNHTRVRPTTADAIAKVYDELHMTPGMGWIADRARRQAAQRGWVPPLGWDDIDTDPEPPASSFEVIDEVRVQRVLSGIRQDCTLAERIAVVDAWSGSLNALEQITGWNVRRIIDTRKRAA